MRLRGALDVCWPAIVLSCVGQASGGPGDATAQNGLWVRPGMRMHKDVHTNTVTAKQVPTDAAALQPHSLQIVDRVLTVEKGCC